MENERNVSPVSAHGFNKKTTLRKQGGFSLSIKSIYRFYLSCGSTHKIEFAQQIHNSRGRGLGNYTRDENCARRARLSRFD